MNIKQAKEIPIQAYLLKNGYKPAKTVRGDMWYLSLFRDEKTPSFKVNTNMNTRYDFGQNSGGDIIKLVRELHNVDTSGALQMLDGGILKTTPSPQLAVSVLNEKKGLTLVRTQPVQWFPLINYLKERNIAPAVSEKYLVQVHFQTPKGSDQVALGFKNDAGDYEIRNKIFKGFVGEKKTISSFNTDNDALLLVFEGFFDFLSFASRHRNTKLKQAFIILNSINGQAEAIEKINQISPRSVHFYLDNDSAGKSAFENIRRNINVLDIENHGSDFGEYKDYSEYWMALCK